jgi:hypothetical protein
MKRVGNLVKHCALVAGLLALSGCVSTMAFTAQNGVRVHPVNEEVFEVFARPNGRQSDFWCGAGSYASRELGAPDSAPVYAVGGAGRGVTFDGPDAAQFALKPPSQVSGATNRPAKRGWGPEVGQSTTVGSARRSCAPLPSSDD